MIGVESVQIYFALGWGFGINCRFFMSWSLNFEFEMDIGIVHLYPGFCVDMLIWEMQGSSILMSKV